MVLEAETVRSLVGLTKTRNRRLAISQGQERLK